MVCDNGGFGASQGQIIGKRVISAAAYRGIWGVFFEKNAGGSVFCGLGSDLFYEGGGPVFPYNTLTFSEDARGGRTRLVVFDTWEHVIDAAASLIESILTTSATVTIIATSREGLRVPDEQLWPVPSLTVGLPRHLDEFRE
ncbi:hypothetical protein B4Q13_16405 [Lacticaseibacillus rhamnosus]